MRSMTEGVFLLFSLASCLFKREDPLRLTLFDTSPGGPGEESFCSIRICRFQLATRQLNTRKKKPEGEMTRSVCGLFRDAIERFGGDL